MVATRVAGEYTEGGAHVLVGAEADCKGCFVGIVMGADGARVVGDRC